MDEIRYDDAGDRELWRRFAGGARLAAGSCPNELELAAYADGLASEAERGSIEAHLARCPLCLEAVIEAKRLMAAAEDGLKPALRTRLMAAAEDGLRPALRTHLAAEAEDGLKPALQTRLVVARAQALVPGRSEAARRPRWRVAASWAAAAAASIALGFAGLRAGAAIRDRAHAEARLASEVAFEAPAPFRDLLSTTDALGALASEAREGHHD